ncbi:dirigent protein [Novosphingobium sp. FSW06-99]|uniref:dirigent protein n=1 Tax=Novosphingobium sp. FSW06-99 TaxID=1739113 RepID=UPI00076CC9BD|nr:dirigent protein [Novosphingobium sp. FSW06-99]KUR80851.1 Allene oxide cyclase [Novosphingobium sp. FSW06-99]
MRTLIVLLGALAIPAHAAPVHPTKVDVVERAETDTFSVKGGSAAENVGDVLTFTNPIYDASNSKKVGVDQGYCVRLIVGKTMECHWTLILAKGQIMVDGPVADGDNAPDTTLAVTGGTGAYRGARGDMLIHARDAKATAYDFHYRLM